MPPYTVEHATAVTYKAWQYISADNDRTALLTHHVNRGPRVELHGPEGVTTHHARSLDTAHHLAELWVMQR